MFFFSFLSQCNSGITKYSPFYTCLWYLSNNIFYWDLVYYFLLSNAEDNYSNESLCLFFVKIGWSSVEIKYKYLRFFKLKAISS